jgi:hypothetical protein
LSILKLAEHLFTKSQFNHWLYSKNFHRIYYNGLRRAMAFRNLSDELTILEAPATRNKVIEAIC